MTKRPPDGFEMGVLKNAKNIDYQYDSHCGVTQVI